MNTLPFRLFFLSIILSPTSLIAGPSDFTCTPTHVNTLSDAGVLVPDKPFPSFFKPFVIDRKTGRVVGGLLDNSGMQIFLIDRGSSQQSFKVAAQTPTRVVHAMYLQVNDFSSGSQKPFLGVRSPNSLVITGFCE